MHVCLGVTSCVTVTKYLRIVMEEEKRFTWLTVLVAGW